MEHGTDLCRQQTNYSMDLGRFIQAPSSDECIQTDTQFASIQLICAELGRPLAFDSSYHSVILDNVRQK